jgi:hypothetical protein
LSYAKVIKDAHIELQDWYLKKQKRVTTTLCLKLVQ